MNRVMAITLIATTGIAYAAVLNANFCDYGFVFTGQQPAVQLVNNSVDE